MTKHESGSDDSAPDTFPIIALCGSAGGLEAYLDFFSVMPSNSGMAFIVVQHQHQQQDSILDSILQRVTRLQVSAMSDGMLLQPDRVFVLPSGKEVSIQAGRCLLTDFQPTRGWPKTIDRFLQSLAQDAGPRAAALILSGVGVDGTEGARAISKHGGKVIAQEPGSALQGEMSRNVIDSGLVNAVLLVKQMPAYLHKAFGVEMKPRVDLDKLDDLISEAELTQLFQHLRRQTGRNFNEYKVSTMRRQIARRMTASQRDTVGEYLNYMQQNPEEADRLECYLLINVTSFFRDPEAFETLKTEALQPLLNELNIDSVFRAWVPGCASGEEAISIAILVHECLRELNMSDMEVRIFATDANRELIQRARTGVYPLSIRDQISEARLRDHFVEEEGGYRVRNHISRKIIWSEHNLVEHPPFSQLHLISCRNVLIYFQKRLQDRVFSLFEYALRPGGVLFLGSSETMAFSTDEFTPVDTKAKVYRRVTGASRSWLQLDQPLFKQLPDYVEVSMPAQEVPKRGDGAQELAVTQDMLLQHYNPTSMIVDEHYQVRYAYGEIDRYLRVIPGMSGQRSALETAREGLDVNLTIALHDAFLDDERTVVRPGVWVKTNGHERIINLVVKPIRREQLSGRLKLVIFELVREGTDLRSLDLPGKHEDQETSALIARLHAELKQTEEVLQNTTQALQAKSEELTTSMEEIRSANEEVQTTNEELRTSKEELESLNEELNTLNTQLTDQNFELTRAKNTLHNFLQSTEMGIIFLDQDLTIREYTSAVTSIFGLRRSDVGRPLAEIAVQLTQNDLIDDAQNVLETLTNVEKEVVTTDGRWYDVRIRTYRTINNVIDGVVLTFTDITMQKQTLASLQESEVRSRVLVEAVAQAVWESNAEGIVVTDSPSWRSYTGQTYDEWLHNSWLNAVHPDDRATAERQWREAVAQRKLLNAEFRVRYAGGGWRWTKTYAAPIYDPQGSFQKWVGMNIDIHERKMAEEQLERLLTYQRELMDSIENGLVEIDSDMRVQNANAAFLRMFHLDATDVIGSLVFVMDGSRWDVADLRNLLINVLPNQQTARDYKITADLSVLGPRTIRLNARQIPELDRVLLVVTDISG